MNQVEIRDQALEIFRQFENHFIMDRQDHGDDDLEVKSIDEYTKWPNTRIDMGTQLQHAEEDLYVLSVTDGSEAGVRTLFLIVDEAAVNTVILRYEGRTQLIYQDGQMQYGDE